MFDRIYKKLQKQVILIYILKLLSTESSTILKQKALNYHEKIPT